MRGVSGCSRLNKQKGGDFAYPAYQLRTRLALGSPTVVTMRIGARSSRAISHRTVSGGAPERGFPKASSPRAACTDEMVVPVLPVDTITSPSAERFHFLCAFRPHTGVSEFRCVRGVCACAHIATLSLASIPVGRVMRALPFWCARP